MSITKVFISAELADLKDRENVRRTHALEVTLSSALFCTRVQRVRGSYKGVPEVSFAVSINDRAELDVLVALGRAFGQESLLGIDYETPGRPYAFLILLDPKGVTYELIGTFRKLASSEPLPDGYSSVAGETFVVDPLQWVA